MIQHEKLTFNFVEKAPAITSQEFTHLFARYREPLEKIAFSYIHDKPAAEDIVSDCFTRFWDKREDISLVSSPEAYLFTSVKNHCLNFLRNKATKLRIEKNIYNDIYNSIITEIEVLEETDSDTFFRGDIRHIFEEFAKTMPEMTRDIFFSSRFEGLTYDQIAGKYGISARKVKREIQKVLDILRKSLKDYLPSIIVTACFLLLY